MKPFSHYHLKRWDFYEAMDAFYEGLIFELQPIQWWDQCGF